MPQELLSKQRYDNGCESGSEEVDVEMETDQGRFYGRPGKIFKSKKKDPGVCGLVNMGNTCFMNSALQCLANIPQLVGFGQVEFFVSGQYHVQINKGNKNTKGGAVAKEFGKLLQEMWCGQNSRIIPKDFRSEIAQLAPDFKGYHQHDTQEFTMFLLDGLHDDLNRAKKENSLPNPEHEPETPMQQVADAAWRKYKSDNDSIITDLMHGQLKSTLICTNCKAESFTFDPFCYLSLPLPLPPKEGKSWFQAIIKPEEGKEVTITECLSMFTEPEQIEKNCSCGFKLCERVLNIWRLPEILIVHLKRYQFVGTSMLKIGTTVKFSVRNFELGDAVANPEEKYQQYELISATHHSGSLTDGHYTAFVLKKQWYNISDDILLSSFDVEETADVVSSNKVYMLYYRKLKLAPTTVLDEDGVKECESEDENSEQHN